VNDEYGITYMTVVIWCVFDENDWLLGDCFGVCELSN